MVSALGGNAIASVSDGAPVGGTVTLVTLGEGCEDRRGCQMKLSIGEKGTGEERAGDRSKERFLVLSVALVANGRPEDRKRRYLNNICSSLVLVGVGMVLQRTVRGRAAVSGLRSRARERDNSVAPFSRAEIVLLPESREHGEQR